MSADTNIKKNLHKNFQNDKDFNQNYAFDSSNKLKFVDLTHLNNRPVFN